MRVLDRYTESRLKIANAVFHGFKSAVQPRHQLAAL